MDEKSNTVNFAFQAFTLIATIIPLILTFTQSFGKIDPQTFIYLGIVIGVALMGIAFAFVYDNWAKIRADVNMNKNDVQELKKSLNFKNVFDGVNTRLKVMETLFKDKKGEFTLVDPRIVITILLLIFLYLFLKSLYGW